MIKGVYSITHYATPYKSATIKKKTVCITSGHSQAKNANNFTINHGDLTLCFWHCSISSCIPLLLLVVYPILSPGLKLVNPP